MTRFRGALIGCGFFAQNHLNAWRDLRAEGVDLVAVCDIDPAKAEAAAKTFGVPKHYTDVAAMFAAEKLDFVDIATQMRAHETLAALAVKHGVRAIIQKPLAPDWDTCVRIVAGAAKAGVPVAVHENFRYQTPMLELQKTLESGVIGKPSWARMSFRTCYDVYRTQPYFHDEERFCILDVGIHVLDLARVFLGEVAHVSCETQQRNARNKGEDTATIMMRHVSGTVSVIECTYENKQLPDPFPQTLISIEGDRGGIRLHENFRMVVTSEGKNSERIVSSPLLPWTAEPWHVAQESVLLTQRAIIKSWRAGEGAETSGADNLKTYALVEAAYESAATGRACKPPVWEG